MKPNELQAIIRRYWIESFRDNPMAISGDVPVIFGDIVKDSFVHHLNIDYGIKLDMDEGSGSHIRDYAIVDEKKYIMFLLKWS